MFPGRLHIAQNGDTPVKDTSGEKKMLTFMEINGFKEESISESVEAQFKEN